MYRAERDPTPIRPTSLPGLAWRTVVDDRQTYRKVGKRSLRDIFGSIWPGLREPVFLLGAPRSGTTLLGRCVGALPGLSYHFEPVATKAAARYIYEQRWSEPVGRLYYRSVYRWLLRIHGDGRMRFAEKTPRNCFIADFLHRVFPGARFLLIVRDGRDAALSYRDQPWLRCDAADTRRRDPAGYPHGPDPRFWVEEERRSEFRETTDLHRCVWAWRRHNEVALEHLGTMPDGCHLTLRYEGLTHRPANEAQRILDFLGVTEPSARMAFLEEADRASPRSVGRWRGEATPGELEMIEREAGSLLRALGYTEPAPRE